MVGSVIISGQMKRFFASGRAENRIKQTADVLTPRGFPSRQRSCLH